MGKRIIKPAEKYKGWICPLCTDGNEKLDAVRADKIVEHLFVLVTEQGGKRHFHIHGPVDDKVLVKEMMIFIAKECGFNVKG